MDNKIDFVLPWVDGNDPAWLAQRDAHMPGDRGDNRAARFRDWDNLQYWFRAVEKFAPWVNSIHFITWGHLPKWLNPNAPKLHIVNHNEYIPEKYLPTFSSHTIELNLHRIPGLAEQFVYFNDDTFLLRPIAPTYFFRDGLPCDYAVLFPYPEVWKENVCGIVTQNMININMRFKKRDMLRKHPFKYLHPAYGKLLRYTFAGMVYPSIVGFWGSHHPNAYLKSTYENVWRECEDVLNETCSHPFRTQQDVNQWLMRYWQLASGQFTPCSTKGRRLFHLHDENPETIRVLRGQSATMICLNDAPRITDIEKPKRAIIEAFQSILPEKCSFEK